MTDEQEIKLVPRLGFNTCTVIFPSTCYLFDHQTLEKAMYNEPFVHQLRIEAMVHTVGFDFRNKNYVFYGESYLIKDYYSNFENKTIKSIEYTCRFYKKTMWFKIKKFFYELFS